MEGADGARSAVLRDGELYGLDGCPIRSPDVEAKARDVLAGRADAPALGPLKAATLVAPWRPPNVIAIGLNYHDHIRETGMPAPASPLVFVKLPSSVTGPHGPIVVDRGLTQAVDWEVELAVVIGRSMRNVAAADALDHVLGYTVANDVSARDVQQADGQWVRAKSFRTFCPLGPAVVTADEVGDPQRLRLSTRVNGELVQDSSTEEMIFSVAEILSFCSRSFELQRGDVVLTGTPWGCGGFMDPPRSLHAGDVVTCEVEAIGALHNEVTDAGDRCEHATRGETPCPV